MSPGFLLTGEMVIVPISIHIAFSETRYEASDSSPFSPICLTDHFCRSPAEGKWREEAKRMIKSRNNFYVVSLNSRFIPVLLLWLQLKKKKRWGGGKRCRGGGGGWQVNHLVILSSFLVAKVKCALRSGASKQAGDEKRLSEMQHGERCSPVSAAQAAWDISLGAIKHPRETTTKKKKKGKRRKHLVTYLLNKCNTGVYLWQDWRAGVMNGRSKVI